MLQVEGLSFSFSHSPMLKFPDIKLDNNDQFLILGKSGSGKTTLLHLIAGLLHPVAGNILIDNIEIPRLGKRDCDRFRGKNIGLVFQQPHLISALTVIQNLNLSHFFNGIREKDRGMHLLKELGIAEKVSAKPHHLSHGEKQRVSIARALMNHPKLILADEPTANLDDDNTQTVTRMLKEQAEKHDAALVIATHDQRLKSMFNKQITLS